MGAILITALAAALGAGSDIDLGDVDQKPPKKEELKAPKKADGAAAAEFRATVAGKTAKGEKRNLYVLVTPLSNEGLAGTWWVQQEVARSGEAFTAEVQFGEEDAGAGEYFAVLAVATDKTWAVGEMLSGLPEGAAYTKLKVVKRK
jgi:hypothetical protein